MNSIEIGNRIHALRKKKGMTQEQLAASLSVTPQAVSKWESGLTFPDVTMLPIIAGFFETSLDDLFGYDVTQMKGRIRSIIGEAEALFYSDIKAYIARIRDAMKEYPNSELLLSALCNAYEYEMREKGEKSHIEELISLTDRLISESSDWERVCGAKETQASAYLEKGEYAKARAILLTLPEDPALRYDTMAYRLRGQDKQESALRAERHHLQYLYRACWEEGNAWFDKECDGAPSQEEENIARAMQCYQKGAAVLELFLQEGDGQSAYLWEGMQTFHWGFYMRQAACCHRLGKEEACADFMERAYRIVTGAWEDFEANRAYYMDPFEEYAREWGLSAYLR